MAIASMSVAGMAQLQSGIKMENLNQSVKAGDDFYEFACGGWMKNNPLPAAYARFGSFDQLGQDNNVRINNILKDLLTKEYAAGTNERKMSDYYKLAMDSARRNREGVKPVMPLIREMEAAKTKAALMKLMEKYAMKGFGRVYSAYFGADEKDSKNNILSINQSGLTLGQKDYYVADDPATTAIREAYKKHVVRMFRLFGFNQQQAQQKMQNIFRFETELAKVSKSRTELRDPAANYNKMTLNEAESRWPNLRIMQLLFSNGVQPEHVLKLVVGQPSFMDGADKLTANMTADALRAYMEWDVINSSTGYLSDEVSEANFDFFGRTMQGRKEDHPRWKRATSLVETVFGEALGTIYGERHFPAASKERMEKLVRNLQVALSERIDAQDWMSAETKKAAHAKLDAFYVKIGYPNKWKDMSGLTIDPSKSYYENAQACSEFFFKQHIAEKAGKRVDRDEWHMTPQTVNAYYNPTTNEICFPAGILQYPFFDATADDAFNYGAIGVVIGHEMTHGFDDQGRQYDKDGNMKDWWTESDGKNCIARTDKYADFFSAIKVLPDLNGNGRLTLGENLADHGGLQVAFTAFKNATKDAPLTDIDGFTPEQRFFLAYAGVWGQNITEAEIRNRTKSDPHALGMWRVNGALPHIDMWYDAFGVKEGDKMFIPKSERLQLW